MVNALPRRGGRAPETRNGPLTRCNGDARRHALSRCNEKFVGSVKRNAKRRLSYRAHGSFDRIALYMRLPYETRFIRSAAQRLSFRGTHRYNCIERLKSSFTDISLHGIHRSLMRDRCQIQSYIATRYKSRFIDIR